MSSKVEWWDPWADEDRLSLAPLPGRLWRVLKDYQVVTPGGFAIVVPEGFETNLSSSPRPLWWYLPPFGDYTPAAVVHDWLYFSGTVPRKEADTIFLAHMKACGVRPTQARLKYWAVRMFGWQAWNRYRSVAEA